jgi:hypothetical protein
MRTPVRDAAQTPTSTPAADQPEEAAVAAAAAFFPSAPKAKGASQPPVAYVQPDWGGEPSESFRLEVRVCVSTAPTRSVAVHRASSVSGGARWVTLRARLGDAESSLGDATSSLGGAKSSLGGAKSSLGDAKSSLGDARGLAG